MGSSWRFKKKKLLKNKDNIKILEIRNLEWKDIFKYIQQYDENKVFMYNQHKNLGEKYFDIDKKYLTKEFYDKYLKKPVEYAIKHYGDNIERLW